MRRDLTPISVDLFAGGGGASLGIEQALGRPVDVAVNHDPEAVSMHQLNHPATQHWTQDVWQVDPLKVAAGRPVGLLWASPDCTHHSKAKGGKPRESKRRDLAWVVIEWARKVRPTVILLENVEEFQTWGPLDPDGYPIKERKGETFNEWAVALRAEGYAVEWRELRACDYGAPTIRKRLFVVARCDGQPIRWPRPSHAKVGGGGLTPWRTAAACIDWDIPCPSIFDRKKDLADATLRRVARGVKRFVIDAAEPFIVALTHHGGDRVHSVSEPFRTITGAHRGELAFVTPFLTVFQQNIIGQPVTDPVGTVMAGAPRFGLVAPVIVRNNHDGAGKDADSVDEPLRTVTTQTNKHVLVAAFLAKHFGNGVTGVPVQTPLPTILTKAAQTQVVAAHLIQHNGQSTGQEAARPLATVVAGPHLGVVASFLTAYYGSERNGQPMTDPLRTVTTDDRFALVMVQGEPYVIADIGMRMLTPRELFRAQGFPDGYVIDRGADGRALTKTAQIRMCGNSVPPHFAAALVRANVSFGRQTELWRGYELAQPVAAGAGGA